MPLFVGEVVDIFCGIGGISHGFKQAGFDIRAGYDLDISCKYGYEENNAAPFFFEDIETLGADEVASKFTWTCPTVLVGCAPCQPFSDYKKGKSDDRWCLLGRFAELATHISTDFVTMENVPGLLEYQGGSVFRSFLDIISKTYPYLSYKVVNCCELGVPQRRHRLVLIASKSCEVEVEKLEESPPKNVADAIFGLPKIPAGVADPLDPMHRASNLSPINIRRIQQSTPGGSWNDWPDDLVAKCHRGKKGAGYRSVYGRMSWDRPAPTITTQCYGYGNGRFGHPEQNRAITLREAALLQSFPVDYKFFPNLMFPGFKTVGRWIGNAVPVALAKGIARYLTKEISAHG